MTQPREFALVFLAAKLVLAFRGLLVLGLFGLVRTFCQSHSVLPGYVYIMHMCAY